MPKQVQKAKASAPKPEKKQEEEKAPRVTASSVAFEILCRKLVPTDEEIIAEVRERVEEAGGQTKFDGTHLAWYKSRFRLGALSGMEGEGRTFNQPVQHGPGYERKSPAKKAAPAKPAKNGHKAQKAKPAPQVEEDEESGEDEDSEG